MQILENFTLPDMVIYGGDTTEWDIYIMPIDKSVFAFDDEADYSVTLSFTPLKAVASMAFGEEVCDPVLTKVALLEQDDDGNTFAAITFSESDTIGLRGTYVYQVEFQSDLDLQVCQGRVTIRQNINR